MVCSRQIAGKQYVGISGESFPVCRFCVNEIYGEWRFFGGLMPKKGKYWNNSINFEK